MLTLQRTHGNQAVLRMLGQQPNGAPPIQRLTDATTFATGLARTGQRYGGKSLGNIIDQLRNYHIEKKAIGDKADKSKLVTTLTKLIEMCTAWISGFPKGLSAKEDLANKTAVETLAKDAGVEQRVVTTGKTEAEVKREEEEEEVEVEIPPLPAQRGTKIEDRLNWMWAKAQQADATEEQQGALEMITKAQSELKRVMGRQRAQMQADDAANSGDKAYWQSKANGYKIGSGEQALSFMMGRLFELFEFTPLAFENALIADPQQQVEAFSAKARELFSALKLTSTDGQKTFGGFDNVILIVAGSSFVGYSESKGTNFGQQSDVDLGVASLELLNACKAAGAQLRGINDRTDADPLPAIKSISAELKKLVPYVHTTQGKGRGGKTTTENRERKVSIMVYKSREAAQRQAGVELP
jgi:hypothetical protein